MSNTRAAPATIADRDRTGPISELERQRVVDALTYARSEPARMRPMLNDAEAATLDMMRRLRAAHHDAAPSVSRLAEYLGWTRSAVVEQLEALRRKGFIRRADDCSTYLETCEAVGFRCVVPLIALALDLATIDPRDLAAGRDAIARHHANAVDIVRLLAELVPGAIIMANKDTAQGVLRRSQIPARSIRNEPVVRSLVSARSRAIAA